MADAADSKSAARECVRVRVPPPAPLLPSPLPFPMSLAVSSMILRSAVIGMDCPFRRRRALFPGN